MDREKEEKLSKIIVTTAGLLAAMGIASGVMYNHPRAERLQAPELIEETIVTEYSLKDRLLNTANELVDTVQDFMKLLP